MEEEVIKAMTPFYDHRFGNASSKHQHGLEANEALTKAKDQIAKNVSCLPEEIVFTSGATEAINLALKGYYLAHYSRSQHVVTVKTEHKAVLDTCSWLEEIGAKVTYLNCKSSG